MSEYAFSGPGDINRSADGPEPDGVSRSATTPESQSMNELAAQSLREMPEFATPLYEAGIHNAYLNHEYGKS